MLKGDAANPLVALSRMVKGPRGQAVGAITSDTKEVAAIIRQAYGKIYARNVKWIDAMANTVSRFVGNIVWGKEAEMEDITGEDIVEEVRNLKETAAGLVGPCRHEVVAQGRM